MDELDDKIQELQESGKLPSGKELQAMAEDERQKVLNTHFKEKKIRMLSEIQNRTVYAILARPKKGLRKKPYRKINTPYRDADGNVVIKPLAYEDKKIARSRMCGLKMGEDELTPAFPPSVFQFTLHEGYLK